MAASRRQFLQKGMALGLCLALPLTPELHAASLVHAQQSINDTPARMLAAWQQTTGRYQLGVLQLNPGRADFFEVQWAVDLPNRPHGLMHLQDDDYLVIARRPGDWMMRLNVRTGKTARFWQEADRHLNGHSAVFGDFLYTTETDVLRGGGGGVLGVRNRSTFELLDVWSTHGRDPHEMLVIEQGGFGIKEPFLLVANGGIPTHADMGRTRLNLLDMDSSVVALQPSTGELLKKWVLNDPQLSLRHMANHSSGIVGIAMQAQHDNAEQRNATSVLALLDAQGLHTVPESTGMKGYAGDIAATLEGFAISCGKSNTALRFDVQGKCLGRFAAESACALAALGDRVWVGYQSRQPESADNSLVLDNHWMVLQA